MKNVNLIAYLNKLLDHNWELNLENQANIFLTSIDNNKTANREDPYKVLTSKLFEVNICTLANYTLAS